MADLGEIGFCAAPFSHAKGGVIGGMVTDSGGSPAVGRMVHIVDRTQYKEGDVPVFDKTTTNALGSYAFAGLDASFSAGPRKYAVLCFDDTDGFPALVLDKVLPV